MKKMTKISAIVASLVVVGAANAATTGGYVGAGLGDSILRTNNIGTEAGVSTSQSRGGLGGRVFAGYNFNENFGLEAALATYANSTAKASTSVPGFGVISASQKNSLSALSLVGKGYLPIATTGLNAYVLGGLAAVRSEMRLSGNAAELAGMKGTTTTDSLRPTYGVGVSYNLPNNMVTNLELSRIQGKGNTSTDKHAIPNADMVSLNLGYNFG